MRTAAAFAIALMASAWLAGCGYTTQSSLDPQYRSIHVAPFENRSRAYGVQAPLTNAVRRKFVADGRLRVVEHNQADLLLEGVILSYNLRGLSFDENDEVTQFLTIITAGARLSDTATGEILWQDELVSGETTYYTRQTGQTADRLRGNAGAFVPTVRAFASDEENRGASEALEQLATELFYRTVEPW